MLTFFTKTVHCIRKRTGIAYNDREFDNFFGPAIIKGIGSEDLIYEELLGRVLNRIIEYNANIFVSLFSLFFYLFLSLSSSLKLKTDN